MLNNQQKKVKDRENLERAQLLMEEEKFGEAVGFLKDLVNGPNKITDPSLVHDTVRLYSAAKLRFTGERLLQVISTLPTGPIPLSDIATELANLGIRIEAHEIRATVEQYILGGLLGGRLDGDTLIRE